MILPWWMTYYAGAGILVLSSGVAWLYIGLGAKTIQGALMGGYMLFTWGAILMSGVICLNWLTLYLMKKL